MAPRVKSCNGCGARGRPLGIVKNQVDANLLLHQIVVMTRTQIQLPEPLFGKLKRIAQVRDVSVAEIIRRGMEIYVQSCAETEALSPPWTMPVLRGSGGHLADPASVKSEASAMEERFQRK
jgi:hypothetical protein